MIFFCRTEQQRQKAASTDPLILFSSQYKLWWTRGASNGGIKNVFKKNTGVPPMCGTRRPALGPLCFAVEREREVTEMEIWRINSYSIYPGKEEDLRNYTKHIVRKEKWGSLFRLKIVTGIKERWLSKGEKIHSCVKTWGRNKRMILLSLWNKTEYVHCTMFGREKAKRPPRGQIWFSHQNYIIQNSIVTLSGWFLIDSLETSYTHTFFKFSFLRILTNIIDSQAPFPNRND